MEVIRHNITLDVSKPRGVDTVYFRGDGNDHRLVVSLTDAGKPYAISNSCLASIIMVERVSQISGTISQNKIEFPLASIQAGWNTCYIRLTGDGVSSLQSQNFQIYLEVSDPARYDSIEVSNTITNDDVVKIRTIPADAEGNKINSISYNGSTLTPGTGKNVALPVIRHDGSDIDPVDGKIVITSPVKDIKNRQNTSIVNGTTHEAKITLGDVMDKVIMIDTEGETVATSTSPGGVSPNNNKVTLTLPVTNVALVDKHGIETDLCLDEDDEVTSLVKIRADVNIYDEITYNGSLLEELDPNTHEPKGVNQSVAINAFDTVHIANDHNSNNGQTFVASPSDHTLTFNPSNGIKIEKDTSPGATSNKINVSFDGSTLTDFDASGITPGNSNQILVSIQDSSDPNIITTEWVDIADVFGSNPNMSVTYNIDIDSLPDLEENQDADWDDVDCFAVSLNNGTTRKVEKSYLMEMFGNYYASRHKTVTVPIAIPDSAWSGTSCDIDIHNNSLISYGITGSDLAGAQTTVHLFPAMQSIVEYTNFGIYCSEIVYNSSTYTTTLTFNKNTSDVPDNTIYVEAEVRIG